MLSSIFRQHKRVLLAVVCTALAVGGAFAYFTSQTSVPLGVVKTAELRVSAASIDSFSGNHWLPGEEKIATWRITNTGTTPVFVKGFLTGSWGDVSLDSSVVKIKRIERLSEGSWVVVLDAAMELGSEFFHSATGGDLGLEALEPAAEVQYRVTAVLDANAGDEYQLQEFTTALHVAARQTTSGATWPLAY
jgi:predicted ribosomally synthesized peptide with SipW-like signal peptide